MTRLNVILISYNQEDYIEQALNSILMQKTDFSFNVIVADDASTDNTLRKIKSTATNSAVEFVYLDYSKNLGFIKNYKRAFACCDAEYIAILEGDDYWTSCYHLQNHVDFLDQHKDFVLSFNRHDRIFVDKGYNDIPEWNVTGSYETIESSELALGNRIGNLSCCVLRNKPLSDQLFETNYFADWLLGLYLGTFGKLALQKEVTSAYRVHSNGQWSRMSEQEQYLSMLKMIDVFDPLLNFRYNKEFSLYKKRINIHLYGDKSVKGKIKKLLPKSVYNKYKKWRYSE